MKNIKNLTAYILITTILLTTILALLGVWDIIDFDDVLKKIFYSLLIIFIASAVALFIFNVMIKDQDNNKLQNP